MYAFMSGVTFLAYGLDKSAARSGRPRTREATLHAMALFGGWPGALAARIIFRHKTRKQPFRTIFWLTVAANIAVLALLVNGLLATMR